MGPRVSKDDFRVFICGNWLGRCWIIRLSERGQNCCRFHFVVSICFLFWLTETFPNFFSFFFQPVYHVFGNDNIFYFIPNYLWIFLVFVSGRDICVRTLCVHLGLLVGIGGYMQELTPIDTHYNTSHPMICIHPCTKCITSLYFILSNQKLNDLINLLLEQYSIAEQHHEDSTALEIQIENQTQMAATR